MFFCSTIKLALLQGCLILIEINIATTQDFPFDLSTGIGLLNQSSSEITSEIPNWFSYNYDGGETNIRDGGHDMYDVGNKVTVSESGTEYNVRYGDTHRFVHSEFSSNPGHPFIALLKVNNVDRAYLAYKIRVYGDIGADGRGQIRRFSGTTTAGNFTTSYHVFQTYGTSDPVICQVYFVVYNREEWQSVVPTFPTPIYGRNTSVLDNMVTFSGRSSRIVLGYVLLSRWSGVSSHRSIYTYELENAMREILFALADFPFILSNALTSIYESSSEITSLIPNWFSYNYDGGETNIFDGGLDMYDVGNRISIRGNTFTVNNAMYNQNYTFGEAIFSSSGGHPFIGLLRIRNRQLYHATYSIRVSGDAGADGSGRLTALSGVVTDGMYIMNYRSFQVSDAGDPTICEVYFDLYSEVAWRSQKQSSVSFIHGRSTNYLNNTFTLTGVSNRMVMGYVLLSRYPGIAINQIQLDVVMRKIMDVLVGDSINGCAGGTVGSAQCSCLPGFYGNGIRCLDVDECNSVNCGANAHCTNTYGNYTCSCNTGFSKIDTRCLDVDECNSVNCGTNAHCTNTYGNYTCSCNTGFSYIDGSTCTAATTMPFNNVEPTNSTPTSNIIGIALGGGAVGIAVIGGVVAIVIFMKRRQSNPARHASTSTTVSSTVIHSNQAPQPPPFPPRTPHGGFPVCQTGYINPNTHGGVVENIYANPDTFRSPPDTTSTNEPPKYEDLYLNPVTTPNINENYIELGMAS